MQILLNINLVGYGIKLRVLAFLLRLDKRTFFKLNLRLRILNTYLSNLRLLIRISLFVL